MSDPKDQKKPGEEEFILDLSEDREQGLASNFEDLDLGAVLPAEDSAPGAGITLEAAEAVEELVFDVTNASSAPEMPGSEAAAAEAVSLPDPALAEPEEDLGLAFEANTNEQQEAIASLGEKLFEFVVCDHPFEQMMEEILVLVLHRIGAQAGSILEMDHDRNEFFFRATFGGGDPVKVKSFRVPAKSGIVGHVAESRQSLLLRNLDTDEKQLRAISMSTGFETKSCLAAPILVANQLYGVIELFNRMPDQTFNEQNQAALEKAMKMVGKILETRFLLAELMKRAR